MSAITKLLKIKDYITLAGTILGLTALICALIGDRAWISLGFFLISFTILTDLLDGYVARKTGTFNEIGKELDSLSDSMTFGITPAMLTFQAFRTGDLYDFVLGIGCILFAIGAILRLARFNISTDDPGYTGVPTPISGLLAILFFYINYFYAYALGGPGISGMTYPLPKVSYYLVPFIMGIIAWFNITTKIQFKEKDKSVYITFVVFAPLSPIFGIIGLLMHNMTPEQSYDTSITLCIVFICFYLLTFAILIRGFFIKASESTKQPKKEMME